MSADYLDWYEDVFEEAQEPLNEETSEWLDRAMHRIAGLSHPQEDPNAVLEVLRDRFLRLGPPGRQLLAAHLRDEAFSRRDSPMRPRQGCGYYDNETNQYS